MSAEHLVFIISRLVFGAGSTFLAIILWSRTRDTAWMFIVVGTIFRYGQIMFDTFGVFGVVKSELVLVPGYLGIDTVLENLPYVFFMIAFIIMIRRTFQKWR